MKLHIAIITSIAFIPVNYSIAEPATIDKLIQLYASQGATAASAEQGKLLWQKKFTGKGEFKSRSCTSCHGKDLTATGSHIKTSKAIKAMAPGTNPDRLKDSRKIQKWFKRNCKWTLGRECSAQEKSDLLLYINNSTRL